MILFPLCNIETTVYMEIKYTPKRSSKTPLIVNLYNEKSTYSDLAVATLKTIPSIQTVTNLVITRHGPFFSSVLCEASPRLKDLRASKKFGSTSESAI
ncbi:MAG: hypothetical protein V4489_10240 [Chlamydiota bacterium]